MGTVSRMNLYFNVTVARKKFLDVEFQKTCGKSHKAFHSKLTVQSIYFNMDIGLQLLLLYKIQDTSKIVREIK